MPSKTRIANAAALLLTFANARLEAEVIQQANGPVIVVVATGLAEEPSGFVVWSSGIIEQVEQFEQVREMLHTLGFWVWANDEVTAMVDKYWKRFPEGGW